MSCLNNIHSACIFFGNITTEKWGSNVNTFYFSTVNLAKSFLFTLLDKKNANVHTEFNKFLSLACIKIASTTRMCGTLPQLQSYWHWHTVRVQHNHIHCEYRSHMSFLLYDLRQGDVGFLKQTLLVPKARLKTLGIQTCEHWETVWRCSIYTAHTHCIGCSKPQQASVSEHFGSLDLSFERELCIFVNTVSAALDLRL